jgi:hypothetical protein
VVGAWGITWDVVLLSQVWLSFLTLAQWVSNLAATGQTWGPLLYVRHRIRDRIRPVSSLQQAINFGFMEVGRAPAV